MNMNKTLITALLFTSFASPSAFSSPMWCQGSDGYWYSVTSSQQAEKLQLSNCGSARERSSAGLEAMATDMAMVAVVRANGSSEIVYNTGIGDAFAHLAKLQKYSEDLLSDKIISILEIRATQLLRCSSESGVALTPDDQVWAAELAGFTNCQNELEITSAERSSLFFINDGKVQHVTATKKDGILKEFSNFKIRNQANEEKLSSKLYLDS